MIFSPQVQGKKFKSNSGLTLVELLVACFLTVILLGALGRMVNEYLLTSKTLTVASDANIEVVSLLRNIRFTFQTSMPETDASGVKFSRERGCVLSGSGDDISDYTCVIQSAGQSGSAVATAGLGFQVERNGKPKVAYVNACEAIPSGMQYPVGRQMLNVPPSSLDSFSTWGRSDHVCPSACEIGSRPVIRFLRDGGVNPIQIPRRIANKNDASALNLWGASICASYFFDEVRQLQRLWGDNSGAFFPSYLSIVVFVARGHFDRTAASGKSLFSWVHGGTVLEFNSTQELSTFRCTPGKAGEYGCLNQAPTESE